MSVSKFPKPEETHTYYWRYISLLDGDDIQEILEKQTNAVQAFLESIPEDKYDYKYEANKWSIKGVIRHITDCERVFAYRLLRFVRNDQTALPGFDQDLFMKNFNEQEHGWEDIKTEWLTTRFATFSLLQTLKESDWDKSGEASGHTHTVRALAYKIAGHELHHVEILKERYL